MAASRRQQERKAETRAELLDAAAHVFAQHGLQGASLEHVADRAGFTTGAIYRHFQSKQDLFLRLFEDRIEQRVRAIEIAAEAHTLEEQATRAGQQFARALTADPDWYLLLFEYWLQAARDPIFRDRFAKVHHDAQRVVAALIADHVKHLGHPLGMPAEELSVSLLAVSYGFALERLLGPGEASDELVARTLSAVALQGGHSTKDN